MKSNEIKPGRAHDDLRCIAVIIMWILTGLCIGTVLGVVCIALFWVLYVLYVLYDLSVYAWVLLFIGLVVSIITILVINKWLACPGGTK